MSASNIQVAIKVRPILGNEKEQKQASYWKIAGNSIQLIEGHSEPFYFDHIFDQDVTNQVVFNTLAKQIVDSGMKGFNGTIFAYGQTSSGKTYTMMGEKDNPGVMELATKEIFKEIEKAIDRQFLLRVGYIEIYNEKIYDLLNKSNQDLKIHETPNGDVGVNCSEYIITCEDDLLSYLRLGSKQRKIGNTNMNDRSSRSHAIFRIIIESRKTDKTDEDSVSISILNLVDLAGSERADQTGAIGSRLKEGGHINKSLLFLSCVIKKLTEDKYVNYRDSKLTRILQASLGGNALTAIICTINPTAIDETLSTLNFANRAKAVKNKPQVNEVLTDAAMMKRLEKEINRLQNELTVEKTKNSLIKVGELQKRLNEEILKIINSNSSHHKESTEKRRRTWCPSSAAPHIPEVDLGKPETVGFVPPTSQMPTKLQLPKSVMNFTPHITLRDAYYQEQFKEIQCTPSIDDEFIPADEAFFDGALTPRTSSSHPKGDFHTPDKMPELRTASLTPRLTEKECLINLERELKELETFTNLENKLNVEHEPYNALKQKLENAELLIARYVKEREDYAFIKLDYDEAQEHHTNWQERCKEHESKITELEVKASEFESASKASTEEILRYEKEVTDLKAKVTQLEMENREAVSLEFEFQQHKNKSKRRETELLGALEEKQKEINKLQQSLQTVTNKALNNSKEELHHISRSCDEAETVCIKCKDLQQILSENKQLTQDFENVNLECKSLQLDLEKISSEVESEKLRADSLQTENASLKKDAEQFTSIYGSLEEVQNQIGSLQAEKCKLDSVKIEFEVMSKETANKTAEKINICQDIETLKSQKETLTAECDKLQRELNSNGCLTEELKKLRTENASLHSELQTITTKLEAAQSDYVSLLTENQTKSDSYEKLNMEVALARNELEKLQTECHDTQQKYEQIQVEYNKRESTIGEIQSEYDSIQFKYQCLQREYEKLENDSVQSIADCDRVQTQNENLETEIRELKTKVEEAQRKLLENDSLQVELESLRLEMNRLQGEYEKKRKSASPSKEENNVDLRQENIKLKHDLDNLQLQFNEMQTEYDDLSSQLVDNLADYEYLQNDVAKLQTELENYKTSTADAEEFKAMKNKIAQLQAENQHLIKENSEWEKTISSMSKSMKDKCDEREKLVAELEEIRNESARSTSTLNCDQFSSLSESFVKIEMPTGNGNSRTFLAADAPKSATGSRMIIGSISGITQGAFDELRGTIEFAVSNNDCKSNNEIYDSLEMEENSASANSCDSLESNSRPSNEVQINELVEEKSQLFERIRNLEEAVSLLKIENEKLANIRIELAETHSIIEQLNSDKLELNTICDENKCKINELNEIISQRECDNKKLIADYLELKQTIGPNNFVESVSKEMYEELQHQHEDTCKKLHAHESKIDETVKEYEEMSAVLKLQLLELQSKPKYRAIDENTEVEKSNSDTEYKDQIAAPETTVKIMVEQFEKNIKNETVSDTPVYSELKETISKLHKQLEACKCTELEASLNEKTQQLAELRDNKTAKYEQDICELLEQLKQQECKCKEVQIEIIELKTSLEGKTQESKERADKIEQLNGRYAKMQTEYDDLQEELLSEKKNSAALENSIQKCNQDIHLLQNSVASLNETVATLGDERNEALKQKEALEKEYKTINEQLCLLKNTCVSLSESKGEINEMRNKITLLEEKYQLVKEEKENADEELLKLHEQNKQLNERCEISKNSERSLHGQLQKLVQDHELIVRDKENLEREFHLSNEEFEKLQDKYESHLKIQHELQQKCAELEEELTKVTIEREKLEIELAETKDQREKLKEIHNSERKSLEEKCCTLISEIQLLTTTKNEIQSALDKAKHHSEFLLQQGKDLEEQFNQDLCTVRNSNNSMAQKIDELEEKLDKAETELKIALVKTTSERDEVILQLTNTNNSLITKSTELEEKLALLNQQLEESKEFLLSEANTKSMLEKRVSEKDELIGKLSNENSSLSSKGLELEKQLEESKRSLNTEAHQKKVLEKANSERDDLIIQLTNNNNSLATKSTELEEKLAILENQFEESKRRLSTEVTKLNLSLDTANRLHAMECAKVVDLTFKIDTLENEIQKTQNTIAQRDSLLEQLNKIQIKYNDLAVQHANLELNRSSFEAEINSARAVVIENANLTQQINAIKSTLKEMELKCSSLTTTNNELDSVNKALTKKVESTNQQAEECNRLKDEIIKFEKDLKVTREVLSKSKEQLKTNFAEWSSKEQSFTEQILKLQSNVVTLSAEKKSIQEKLNTEGKASLSKITQLEQQIQLLQKEPGWNVKTISPKKSNVLSKNMNLMEKLDSCQKSQNEERKIRRLSAHDERRRQTFWDSNRDISTMTDPTNAECNCEELDRKLNELKQKLLIRDSQVNTLSMELKNHPLKMENATLKNLLMDEESKQYQLRQELKRCNQLIVSKANESRQCTKCYEASKRIFVDSTTQTIERDESECYRKLQSKYEDLKMICRGRHIKIKELEEALPTGKENANDNVSPLQYQQYRQKYELLKKEFVNLSEKYEEAKILCTKRYEQLKILSSQLSEKS